jgi:hypothetical protein
MFEEPTWFRRLREHQRSPDGEGFVIANAS